MRRFTDRSRDRTTQAVSRIRIAGGAFGPRRSSSSSFQWNCRGLARRREVLAHRIVQSIPVRLELPTR
jgi:hypothetical protein